MSNKSLLKFVIAFGILAVVLIFLGVNFVPRIFASSLGIGNNVVSGIHIRSNYIDEQYQRAIAPQLSYVMSDWIERHPSNVLTGFRTPPMSNYFPSIAVTGFRTPPMSNYFPSIGTERFFTPPPMSNYIRPIGTERFFTPPPADYTP